MTESKRLLWPFGQLTLLQVPASLSCTGKKPPAHCLEGGDGFKKVARDGVMDVWEDTRLGCRVLRLPSTLGGGHIY